MENKNLLIQIKIPDTSDSVADIFQLVATAVRGRHRMAVLRVVKEAPKETTNQQAEALNKVAIWVKAGERNPLEEGEYNVLIDGKLNIVEYVMETWTLLGYYFENNRVEWLEFIPISQLTQPEEPYGYVFNERFYKQLYGLKGQTFSEGDAPIPVFTKAQPTDFEYVLNSGRMEKYPIVATEERPIEKRIFEGAKPLTGKPAEILNSTFKRLMKDQKPETEVNLEELAEGVLSKYKKVFYEDMPQSTGTAIEYDDAKEALKEMYLKGRGDKPNFGK